METDLGDWEVVTNKKDRDVRKHLQTTPADFPYQPPEEKLEEGTDKVIQVINSLDRDETQDGSMTSIDFNTNLQAMEVPALTTLQMLSSLGVGGIECSVLARRIQRNKVSVNRLGREDKVKIMVGEREHETASKDSGLFGKIKGFMGGKQQDNSSGLIK